MAKKPPIEVSIGKFDTLASYVSAQALLHGMDDEDDEVKWLVKIPTTCGAKIKKEQFQERVNKYLSK